MLDSFLPSTQGNFLFELELYTLQRCQPYERSWFSALLALMRYAPQAITFGLYFAGLRYKELYFILFGIGLSLNSKLNELLNFVIGGVPRIETCTAMHGAALAWQSQQVAFFVTFALGYTSLYQAKLKMTHTFALMLFLVLSVISQDFLNYHTPESTIAGVAAGVSLALVYQTLVYLLVVPAFGWLLERRIVRFMGYRDTLCCDYDSTDLVPIS